jgi:predicted alpha/beta-fold hydrolase
LPTNAKLFLVGNSLGANLVTKYLGEEGLSGTLPKCVAGGVSLGNPLSIRSDRLNAFMSSIMALGAKKSLLENWPSIRHMHDPYFRQCFRLALMEPTLHRVDAALAPIFPRNDPEYPFAYRIGYESADDYWDDASSFVRSSHISVPTLQLIAADDFLVFHSSRARIHYCLNNPNVLVVETKCGGHLGWQESPPDGSWGGVLGSSWSDIATTDFIAAVLESTDGMEQAQTNNVAADEPKIRSRL